LTRSIFPLQRQYAQDIEKYSTKHKTIRGRKMEVEARKEAVLVFATPHGSTPFAECEE
jgi:hypothetical protein